MNPPSQDHEIFKRIHNDLVDSFDEELEMEVEDGMLPEWQVPETEAEKDAAKTELKQWKLSPMDLESRRRWEDYTKAKEIMFDRTHTADAPWWVIQAVDKKKARLNCIHHLLRQVPYNEVDREQIILPERVYNQDYHRQPVSSEMFVPAVY